MELVEEKGIITRKQYSALDEDVRMNYWQIHWNKFKLMTEMSSDHLQKAFCYAQTKELLHHNNYNLFNELKEQIESEAGRRGPRLSDIDTEFHRKARELKSKSDEETLSDRYKEKISDVNE